MDYAIKLEVTVHECDLTGRHYARFTPVITPQLCASGELRTATYDAWIDEPGEFARQKAAARAGAESALDYVFGRRANARLEAAAPELLAALQGLFEQCTMVHKGWGDRCNRDAADAAIAAARAAIAKATRPEVCLGTAPAPLRPE